MKNWNAVMISALVACGTQFAQADDPAHTSTEHQSTEHESTYESALSSESTTVSGVRLSTLMDTDIKSSTGENLGELEDVILNPQTGEIKFAVLGRGGFLGFGEKLVPVPWKAIDVKSEREFSLKMDKEKLKDAPTVDKQYSNLDQPGYTVTIYRFFAVPEPSAVGGAETPEGIESGTGSSSDYERSADIPASSDDHSSPESETSPRD